MPDCPFSELAEGQRLCQLSAGRGSGRIQTNETKEQFNMTTNAESGTPRLGARPNAGDGAHAAGEGDDTT